LIVIDASAVLELLLLTSKAAKLEDIALSAREQWHAPHLIDVEVAQALRRLMLAKELPLRRAEEALADYGQLLIERHAHQDLLPRVWQLRDSMTAYDAAYVALAEALDTSLITCDGRLARAHGHRARITLV
jgi:predicted nucleic acid-binding protein